MSDGFNLFASEEALADEARKYLADEGEGDCREMLARLLAGYQGLLSETQKLIRIADRRELELNRLNRKLQALTRSLAFQAEHDALTGTLNKAAVTACLSRQLSKTDCCVMVLDLDRFKQVNDTWGHLAGDQVLKCVVDRVQSVIREADTLGRFGGEEFLVIVPESTHLRARALAERIRAIVANEAFELAGGVSLTVTVSIGLCLAACGDSIDAAISRADVALYAAKRGGRNRVEVAE